MRIEDARYRQVVANRAVAHRGAAGGEPTAQPLQFRHRPCSAGQAGCPTPVAAEAAGRVGHRRRPELPAFAVHHGALAQHRQVVAEARERPGLTHPGAPGAAALDQQTRAAGSYPHHGGLLHRGAGKGNQRAAGEAQVAGAAHLRHQLLVGAGPARSRQAQGAGRRRPGQLGPGIEQHLLQVAFAVAQAAALIHRHRQQRAAGNRHHVEEQRRAVAGAPAPAARGQPHLAAAGRRRPGFATVPRRSLPPSCPAPAPTAAR